MKPGAVRKREGARFPTFPFTIMSEAAETTPLTEQENPRTAEFSSLITEEILRLMNEEDARVADAVAQVLTAVTRAVEIIVERLRAGGRLFSLGTATSGRLAVLDVADVPRTLGVCPEVRTVSTDG